MSEKSGQLREVTKSCEASGRPRLDILAKGGWFLLFSGPSYLLFTDAFGWIVSGVAAALSVACFVGGFVTIVLTMGPAPVKSADDAVKASTLAGQLGGLIARILPPDDQARYAEEFAGELFELASGGVSRFQQIAYAIRLASRVWQLRTELLRQALDKVAR